MVVTRSKQSGILYKNHLIFYFFYTNWSANKGTVPLMVSDYLSLPMQHQKHSKRDVDRTIIEELWSPYSTQRHNTA